jgi:rubrerythrin
MEQKLSTYQILNVAQTIEENAVRFYEQTAEMYDGEGMGNFLRKLADYEREHKQKYAAMQAALENGHTEQSDGDFINNMDLYLKAVLDSQNLEGSDFAGVLLRGDESKQELLMIAMDLEKETILFYLGLRDVVAAEKDKQTVDEIIEEEKSHIVILAEELRKLI